MRVIFADFFDDILENCDEQTQNAVDEFVFHVKKYGLKKLKGRNKSSAVPSTTKKGIARYKFAQKHCLWHESGNSKALLCPLARQELCS